MQRRISLVCLALSMICFIPRSHAQRGKSEFGVGYGAPSFYSFLNVSRNYNVPHSNSSGVLGVNYRYYLTRDVTLGLGFGYENISNWGSFVTFAPELTVAYLDTRQERTRIKLYGAFSYGISILQDQNVGVGHADETGPKPWAFQATPLGVRLGRQVAGFLEVGFGYKGIVNGGIVARFPRKAVNRQPKAE